MRGVHPVAQGPRSSARKRLSLSERPVGFDDAAKPHYLGHRERLRKRFRDGGPDALPDYELLELGV